MLQICDEFVTPPSLRFDSVCFGFVVEGFGLGPTFSKIQKCGGGCSEGYLFRTLLNNMSNLTAPYATTISGNFRNFRQTQRAHNSKRKTSIIDDIIRVP